MTGWYTTSEGSLEEWLKWPLLAAALRMSFLASVLRPGNQQVVESIRGAERWRNPDKDLPTAFEFRREGYYRALRKPLNPTALVDELRGEMEHQLGALDEQLEALPWVGGDLRPRGAAVRFARLFRRLDSPDDTIVSSGPLQRGAASASQRLGARPRAGLGTRALSVRERCDRGEAV